MHVHTHPQVILATAPVVAWPAPAKANAFESQMVQAEEMYEIIRSRTGKELPKIEQLTASPSALVRQTTLPTSAQAAARTHPCRPSVRKSTRTPRHPLCLALHSHTHTHTHTHTHAHTSKSMQSRCATALGLRGRQPVGGYCSSHFWLADCLDLGGGTMTRRCLACWKADVTVTVTVTVTGAAPLPELLDLSTVPEVKTRAHARTHTLPQARAKDSTELAEKAMRATGNAITTAAAKLLVVDLRSELESLTTELQVGS
jgi:hypothetical protein